MVNVKKIFNALIWLKCNNPLYRHIILSESHNTLCLEKLNNPEFQIQETENNDEFVLDDDHKLLSPKDTMEETNNNIETVLNNQYKAMLTQIVDDSDGHYDQYIIYPLYKKKTRESTNSYQMLKIQDLPLDNHEKDFDLLFFSDLYPFDING
ncbi:hypothetical protein P5V15_002714 [Pogonomyrmex californicus]